MKKLLSIILAILMIATSVPLAFAADVVASGDCGAQGNNVTWTLDSDGLLTISGEGEMCEIFIYANQPWVNMCDNIREVIIEEGVTLVSRSAFFGCRNLKKITIPASAEFVDLSMALSSVSLDTITISSASPYYTVDEYGVIYSKDMSTIYLATGDLSDVDYVISETVREVDYDAFVGKQIRSLAINCDIDISISDASIDKVTFGPRISAIGIFMFAFSIIGEIIIPKNISYIVEDAFLATDINKAHYLGDIRELNIYGNEALINVLHYCEYISEIPPTCISPGCENWSCNTCYENFERVIPALDHEIVVDEYVAPTCTETGLTEGQHCTRCDDMTVEQEVIPATNHKDTLVQVEAQAKTCTTVGWDAYEYCKDCTYTTKVEIPASGHTKETVKGYAATCTETGLSDGVKCSACGDTLTAQEVIPSNGHTEETVKGYDATCTETGLSDGVKCSACGDTLTEQTVISAKGHADANGDGVCDNGGEAIEKQEPDTPDTPDTPNEPDEPSDEPTDDTTNDCDHLCHSNNAIIKVLWKIISFFYRLFNIQQYCDCGITHW